jgi:hypothetical protein
MDKAKFYEMVADESCVKVVSALFQAIAYCETVRSVIEPKQKEVLAKHQFKIAPKWQERFEKRGFSYDKVIVDHSDLFLIADEDFQVYLDEMDVFHREQGFDKPAKEYCPLLIAENLVRDVKKQVTDFLEPYTGISYDMVSYSLDSYRKYFDLIMGLFAPKVKPVL